MTNQLRDFGLRVQPMAHVESLAAGLDFYEALGGRLVFGSRDGDWALVAFGDTTLSLLAHPPSADNPEPVELQFVSDKPLEELQSHVRATRPELIFQEVSDEAFGRSLKLRTADGLVVKLLELERDLIA